MRWYPAPGWRGDGSGTLYGAGLSGFCWTPIPASSSSVYYLDFNYSGIDPNATTSRAGGLQVRCLQE